MQGKALEHGREELLVAALALGVSLASLGAVVLVSAKVKTFIAAQQSTGFLVLPVIFLMIGQIAGLFFSAKEMSG